MPRSYQADDPAPESASARIRDAINDAFDVAVGEHAPEVAGVAIVAAVTVITDGGDELVLDSRTTVRSDLKRLHDGGVKLGGIRNREVISALLAALGDDADQATR